MIIPEQPRIGETKFASVKNRFEFTASEVRGIDMLANSTHELISLAHFYMNCFSRPPLKVDSNYIKWHQELLNTIKKHCADFIIVRHGSKIVGSLFYHYNTVYDFSQYVFSTKRDYLKLLQTLKSAHVVLVGVNHHYHQQGLATTMLQEVLHKFSMNNIDIATIFVDGYNPKAIECYEKLGFERIAVRSAVLRDGSEEVVVQKYLYAKMLAN